MTSEQRLDRLERIAMLMARAGLRVRREQNEKINIIIDSQIKNEDRFARHEERFATLAAAQQQTDNQIKELARELSASQKITNERFKELAESQKELAESQRHTDERLKALIDIVRRDRNGNSG